MHLRVTDRWGAPFGVLRSLVRLVGLFLAIVPCLAGFVPVLVDRRRSALQDFIAGTVVRVDDAQPIQVEPIAEFGEASSSPLS